jgi:hypothetical protein
MDVDKNDRRPCDLLPLPELNLFNLYTFGVAPDFQLGYAKDKQGFPKKVDFHSLKHPAE